jgi:23S rRNA (uracil1939-C5)-methyltransferase
VEIDVEREKSSHVFASIVSVLEPSPERTEPLCERAEVCGGCPWQHIEVEAQREWKRRLVAQELLRAGLVEELSSIPATAAGDCEGFRTRTRLHQRSGALGTMERRSGSVVPFSSCPVLAPELGAFAAEAARAVPAGAPDAEVELIVDSLGQRGVLVTTRGPARIWDELAAELGVFSHRVRRPGTQAPGPLGRLLYEDSAGTPLAFEPGVFVQTNRQANALLVADAMQQAAGGERFAEIYAGAGNFTVHLATRFARGTAAESGLSSARMLRRNLKPVAGSVDVRSEKDSETARALAALPAADLLFADPPRSGMRALYPLFEAAAPGRVVMVSCHPMTAVRDLAHLTSSAGYTLERVAPIDMFPHSDHVEIVASLTRAS